MPLYTVYTENAQLYLYAATFQEWTTGRSKIVYYKTNLGYIACIYKKHVDLFAAELVKELDNK